MESIDNLLAMRISLKNNLERSKALGSAIDKTGPRLEKITRNFPFLETFGARKCIRVAVIEHIDSALGPAAAVLKVFEAVHGLEKLLLRDPSYDIFGYISITKQLEQALKFLASNCSLAIQWLGDTVEFLEKNEAADEFYIERLKDSFRILKGNEKSFDLDKGFLNLAFYKLEEEFKRLLIEHGKPISMPVASNQLCIESSSLLGSVMVNLKAIICRLKDANRLETCVSIYIEMRSSNVRDSLKALELDYLKVTITEFNDIMSIEGHIEQWCKHLEFVITHLFDLEHKLCNDVFKDVESEIKMGCFAKIVTGSGFFDFLEFGCKVTKCKKDFTKLLKLLEIFSSLNNLRFDFNRLFGGEFCEEIQIQTRNLVRSVVDGIFVIFGHLANQVELQRHAPPPPNGSIQEHISFVIEYCNELLGDKYKPILTQVFTIRHSWNYENTLLTMEILRIINAVELNLERWPKAYEDTILSYIFRINNYRYICRNLKNTELGELMGNSWLNLYEEYVEYYVSIYLRESWEKLRTLLNQEDVNMFISPGTTNAGFFVKKRLKEFNEAFDDMYKKHSNWVIVDKELRKEICELVVKTVVPAYRQYLKNYGVLMEYDGNIGRFMKYNEESLEKMLSSLFLPKVDKFGNTRNSHFIGKVKNVVSNQLRSTLSAA